jgi:glycosyltransferase involved in cell wall biosynthesis
MENEKDILMNMPLISVIVPIYNVEIYLEKCLNSIINQTYKNLEIILIDDGSPDNCGKICDEYAKKDKRIKVIHKPNGGLSDARNTGLDIAKGEYIAFVDSDDYIAEEMCEELLDIAQKEEADIVVCGVYDVRKEGITVFDRNLNVSDKDTILYQIFTDYYPSYSWNKFFKAHLFSEIRFPHIKFEDLFIMPTLILAAQKISFTPKAYYYYNRTNENSITSFLTNPTNRYGAFKAWEERERLSREYCKKAYPLCQKRAIKYSIRALYLNLSSHVLTNQELQDCESYLKQKRQERLAARINIKYRFLWWSLEKYPIFGKLYGKYVISKTAKRRKNG